MRLLMREHEAKEALQLAVQEIPNSELVRVTGVTEEAVRLWKSGRRCPNAASLVNLARGLPAIRDWLLSEIEQGAS